MALVTNGGVIESSMVCTVKGLGDQTVHFHDSYISNILSLGLLKQRYRITYDSTSDDGAFVVHRPGKSPLKFCYASNGLHLLKTKGHGEINLLTTVEEQKKRFSRREISGAKRAKELVATLGYPSDADLRAMLKMGLLHE